MAKDVLAKFALDSWSLLGRSETVDWLDPKRSARPIVEVWKQSDHTGRTIGAMTLHYYHWNRIRRQHYFSIIPNPRQPKRARIFVIPFEDLLERELGMVNSPCVAVELGYFAVDPEARGHGVGSTFFDMFLDRAEMLAPERRGANVRQENPGSSRPWQVERKATCRPRVYEQTSGRSSDEPRSNSNRHASSMTRRVCLACPNSHRTSPLPR